MLSARIVITVTLSSVWMLSAQSQSSRAAAGRS